MSILTPVASIILFIVSPPFPITSLIFSTFIFVDIIRNYNKLAMRRLPQFDKQGGDDRA